MNPLTIFPRHPSAPDTYYINGAWAPAAITAVDKRFTDAELAAEAWQYMASNRQGQGLAERYNVLKRFATLDHYDDGPA